MTPTHAPHEFRPHEFCPHEFWQTVHPAGTFDGDPADGFADFYPASLPDGRQIVLPVRVLPGGTDRAVASLILNQASFAVADALADAVAHKVRGLGAEVVVGLPTLGLTLADALARRLGHSRYVPLGTSRKFWYEEALSEPLSSITSPGTSPGTGPGTSPGAGQKRLYVDPRMLPLIEGRRVLLVDDVVSTGSSMAAALDLLARAGVAPCAIAVAMVQSERWRGTLADRRHASEIVSAISTPLLSRGGNGRWTALS